MPPDPRVFVASSSESKRLAQAVQQNLTNAEVTLWSQDALLVGHVIIDELTRNLERSDFGVFVLAPNDIVLSRGQSQPAARDNVIFELGMFIARLGKERSFIIRPSGVNMRLPTDLLGIITVEYNPERAEREPVAALGPACATIADAMGREFRRKGKELDTIITDALETICCVMSNPVTPEQAALRAFIFRREGEELVCRHFWDPHDQPLERRGRNSFHIDEATAEKVVVVRCFLDNELRRTDRTKASTVKPLPKALKGVKGQYKPEILYVIAAPIRSKIDDSIWGVVDFDTSNRIGKKILEQEEASNKVMLRLARHLGDILAY